MESLEEILKNNVVDECLNKYRYLNSKYRYEPNDNEIQWSKNFDYNKEQKQKEVEDIQNDINHRSNEFKHIERQLKSGATLITEYNPRDEVVSRAVDKINSFHHNASLIQKTFQKSKINSEAQSEFKYQRDTNKTVQDKIDKDKIEGIKRTFINKDEAWEQHMKNLVEFKQLKKDAQTVENKVIDAIESQDIFQLDAEFISASKSQLESAIRLAKKHYNELGLSASYADHAETRARERAEIEVLTNHIVKAESHIEGAQEEIEHKKLAAINNNLKENVAIVNEKENLDLSVHDVNRILPILDKETQKEILSSYQPDTFKIVDGIIKASEKEEGSYFHIGADSDGIPDIIKSRVESCIEVCVNKSKVLEGSFKKLIHTPKKVENSPKQEPQKLTGYIYKDPLHTVGKGKAEGTKITTALMATEINGKKESIKVQIWGKHATELKKGTDITVEGKLQKNVKGHLKVNASTVKIKAVIKAENKKDHEMTKPKTQKKSKGMSM